MTRQERDIHGRYSHQWDGIIAHDTSGGGLREWEGCSGCGRVRNTDTGRTGTVGMIPKTATMPDSDAPFWRDGEAGW